MTFWIQVSNPTFLHCPAQVATDVADAIETIFPMKTERGFIVWNHVYIPFSYKYDLSVMIDDILFMIFKLKETNQGSYKFCFGSNTFNAEWDLSWKDTNLYLSSQWNSLGGRIINMASSDCKHLESQIDVFINEYKKLIDFIVYCIQRSAITIKDTDNYQFLISTSQSIKNYGYLYQEYSNILNIGE